MLSSFPPNFANIRLRCTVIPDVLLSGAESKLSAMFRFPPSLKIPTQPISLRIWSFDISLDSENSPLSNATTRASIRRVLADFGLPLRAIIFIMFRRSFAMLLAAATATRKHSPTHFPCADSARITPNSNHSSIHFFQIIGLSPDFNSPLLASRLPRGEEIASACDPFPF